MFVNTADKKEIPVFFAADNNYAPFVAVALASMLGKASKNYFYKIYVLTTDLSHEYTEQLKNICRDAMPGNASVEFVSLREEMEKTSGTFHLRDYYSRETYCRIFIPRFFSQYDKVIYLDSDLVVTGDISELYNIDIGDNLVGAAIEEVMQSFDVFGTYVEKALGIPREKYFSAGVLLINAKKYREENIEEKFIALMNRFKFRVTQDEDYLNVLCKGKVKWLDVGWNKSAYKTGGFDEKNLKIIHYKINWKPWHYNHVLYEEYFWECAEKTPLYENILKIKASYGVEQKRSDAEAFEKLKRMAIEDTNDPDNYRNTVNRTNIGRNPERLAIVEKIKAYEREGRFSEDVESDPPTVPLRPEMVDYLNKKISSKLWMKFANMLARRHILGLMKSGQMVIKEVRGLENYIPLKRTGAIITCNHFNPMDNFAVYKAIEKHVYHRELVKVCREGNYTNFPGFYGFLFKHCNTMPLSSLPSTMKNFMDAVKTYLSQGRHILIYPEQAMWWNYRKPRPLTPGAYRFAAENNAPVIPMFITMEDSDRSDGFGFPVQEYTVHILPPIYPKAGLSVKKNAEYMRDRNYEVWKEVYESAYGKPLSYAE